MNTALRINEDKASLEASWEIVRGRLKQEYGDDTFASWLKPLSLTRLEEGVLVLSAPTKFIRDWVVGRYAQRIREVWQNMDIAIREVIVNSADRAKKPGAGKAA